MIFFGIVSFLLLFIFWISGIRVMIIALRFRKEYWNMIEGDKE